ncbi:MAG TPA: serine/threonine-protein kinase, partial [Kofleriaceae bacterium]|nr:serine/threonine-protein kinase [Kofleriaceae bacterium]
MRQIAVGGMAEIHLAKTRDGGGAERFVALKMIHPNFAEDEQFIEMLIDEARISIQLHHPNIAHTFDLGRFGETYYLIMEFVDGADLYKILRRGSERDVVTPVDVAAYVVKEVAYGLDYAHHRADEQGRPLQIIHRDVSPQNVIVSYDGAIKLVDFGIAKAASKAQQTAAGVIKGKYYYMSPEQALGEPLDQRTDVFSAGIVLYELLSGQMLYLEEDVNRLLDRVRRADIPSVRTLRRDVPSQLDRIVMRALARRREDRYQTAADLAADLERFLDVFSPAFSPRKLVQFMEQALGDGAGPLLPTTVPPATPPPRRVGGGARSTMAPMPEEFTDENSMIFRMSELQPRGKRRSEPAPVGPPAAPPPRRAGGRASDQRTAPISSGGGGGVGE